MTQSRCGTTKNKHLQGFFSQMLFGGAEGNRTPVRKPIHGAFSERSLSLGFPT